MEERKTEPLGSFHDHFASVELTVEEGGDGFYASEGAELA
jgi:hypothetical protein